MTAIAQAQDDDAEWLRFLAKDHDTWRQPGTAERLRIIATRLSATTPDTTVLVGAGNALLAKLDIVLPATGREITPMSLELGLNGGSAAREIEAFRQALASTANPTGESSNG